MICYWYRDCHGKDTTGYEALKFLRAGSVDELLRVSSAEQFRAFECEHNPTRIRIITFSNKFEPVYGEWHESIQ